MSDSPLPTATLLSLLTPLEVERLREIQRLLEMSQALQERSRLARQNAWLLSQRLEEMDQHGAARRMQRSTQ